MAPSPEVLDRPRPSYLYDRLLVWSFMLAQVAAIARVSHSPLIALTCGIAVPWLVFGWLIGFVIYFNHTHPEVPWFSDATEWSSFEGAIGGTTRLAFPRWAGWFASNIMNHVAHHVDPRIPLARLGEAQARIEQLLPGDVCVEEWSVERLRTILRSCKLYDYDAQCWLDYAGRPTTRALRDRDTR
jgi:omega-6 fatty acid desaturase (delta-12 desaturase)